MSERDDEFDDTVEPDESFDDSLSDEERAELEAGHPLADLSPFADGFEGTNIDDDSDFELEDSEYAQDAQLVYEELLARVGEHAPEPRLEATRRAVELIGDPQRNYPVIHITGTNGKTSTSRIIESILRAYGLRTGLMTSPHLMRVNERIVIDGRAISNRDLSENWADIRPYLLMVDAELLAKGQESLTYFEALTVLAFASFADAPVDVAVLEVGMGGEWDSTNVADGQVAVFGPIALDHTHRLGSTISEIARTKAGIIKPAAAIVSAVQTSDAQIQLERAADLSESKLGFEGDAFELLGSAVAVGGQLISVRGLAGTYSDLFLPLFGEFQGHNAALAIAAVESFLGAGSQALVSDVLAEGLAMVASPGRLQVIGAEPTVIVDAAHNPHGATALAAALKEYFTFDEIAIVIGVLDDKDSSGIIRALAPVANRFYVTASQSDRAVAPEDLVEIVREFSEETTDFDSFVEAMELARDWAAENERRAVVVTGSISLVGEALALAESQGWKP